MEKKKQADIFDSFGVESPKKKKKLEDHAGGQEDPAAGQGFNFRASCWKVSFAKTDEIYRMQRLAQDLPYVKWGERDANGNQRVGKAIGGRPKKEHLHKRQV